MSIYDPGVAHVETYTTADDDLPGDARWSGRAVRRSVEGPRGPLLTLVTRFLWRLGLFCVLSSPVWALPIVALPPAEGLTQPWVQNHATYWAIAMFLNSVGVGLALMFLGAHPGWIVAASLVAVAAAAGTVVTVTPTDRSLVYGFLSLTLGATAAWFIIDAWLRRRKVDPNHVHLGLGVSGSRRTGIALLLLSGVWVAAMRVSLPYHLHIPTSVDVALWGGMPFLWLGLLGIGWHALPQLRTSRERYVDPVEKMVAEARARAMSAPAPKLAHPSVVEPAHVSDLVLPERTLSQIRALIRIIAEPDAAHAAGIEPPVGAILDGPPGTGKTLVARAIAGECGRQVLAFTGSSLSSKWVGESTERISDMFRQARAAAPCIVILDELDGIAPARQGDLSNSAAHRDFAQRINEILQQLDGVGGSLSGVFVIGATNHLDAIDPAVRSRLSHHISIPLPDEAGRAEILRRNFPATTDVTPDEIAHLTQGMSGRDLRELCRAASMAAFSEASATVTRAHFDAALSQVGSDPAPHATRTAEASRVEPAMFADLVLPEGTMSELRTFVRLLRDPDRGREFGAGTPQGAVLYGPPGTGKTLIARAVAGELGRPVLAFSGASLTSMMAGEGSQLIRDTFRQAREQAPCVLFVDELDGVTPSRRPGAFGLGASHDATQQINQFLQEIEGVAGGLRGVCVIGATNHLEAIDEAVLSRLSYHVEIPLPDGGARIEILRRHFPKRAAVTPEELTDLSAGLSGRDLRELCKTAGMIAMGEDAEAVTLEHFRRARARIGRSPAS
jgi:transitional endoplasmic reticulum ATPase